MGQEKFSSLSKPWKAACASGRSWSCHLRPPVTQGCDFFWLSFLPSGSCRQLLLPVECAVRLHRLSCCSFCTMAPVPGSWEGPWCLWSPENFSVLAPKRANRAGGFPEPHVVFHSFPAGTEGLFQLQSDVSQHSLSCAVPCFKGTPGFPGLLFTLKAFQGSLKELPAQRLACFSHFSRFPFLLWRGWRVTVRRK